MLSNAHVLASYKKKYWLHEDEMIFIASCLGQDLHWTMGCRAFYTRLRVYSIYGAYRQLSNGLLQGCRGLTVQYHHHSRRLSLINWVLCSNPNTHTNPTNPLLSYSRWGSQFTLHCGETAFFWGSSNSRHKMLWAIGMVSNPNTQYTAASAAGEWNIKPLLPFNLLLLLLLLHVKVVHCTTLQWRWGHLRKLSTLRDSR